MRHIIGQTVYVDGFVTPEKFIVNQSINEIEKRLGYQKGRFMQGASFLLLTTVPSEADVEVKGYSNVPDHRFKMPAGGLDVKKLKDILLQMWKSENVRLLKVIPNKSHDSTIDNDDQYPPGDGVPQWRLIKAYPAKVVGVYTSHDYANRVRYRRNHS